MVNILYKHVTILIFEKSTLNRRTALIDTEILPLNNRKGFICSTKEGENPSTPFFTFIFIHFPTNSSKFYDQFKHESMK